MTTQGRATAPCAAGGLGGSAWARRHNFKLAVSNHLNECGASNLVCLCQSVKLGLAALNVFRLAAESNADCRRLSLTGFLFHALSIATNTCIVNRTILYATPCKLYSQAL